MGIESLFNLVTPAGVDLTDSLFLILLSAGTSFITAAAGIGGGIVLLAVMAVIMPAHALIPVHGVVQIGSNAGRALVTIRHVNTTVLLPFTLGTGIGALIGGAVAVELPGDVLRIVLGLFILYSVWGKIPTAAKGRSGAIVTGVFSSFLTMFIGATGPFVSAMIKTLKLDRMSHTATHATSMTVQHLLKVVSFGLFGFGFAPYAGFIVAMILSGFIGTLVGKQVVLRLNDQVFHRVLGLVLTVLAAKLIYDGLATHLV